jgi:hypothetical protein
MRAIGPCFISRRDTSNQPGVAKRHPGIGCGEGKPTPKGLQQGLKPLRGRDPFGRLTRGARSVTPGLDAEKENQPRRGCRPDPSLQISGIVSHTSLGQELNELLSERSRPMMFLLTRDVSRNGVPGVGTDRECGITRLPCEIPDSNRIMHPDRRTPFDLANHLRQRTTRAHPSQDVHVIGNSTNDLGLSVHTMKNSSDVFVESGPPCRFNERLTIPRREHDMIMKAQVRGGHDGGMDVVRARQPIASKRAARIRVTSETLLGWNPG